MPTVNSADQSLTLAVAHLTTGLRARRLALAWADDAHLGGWTPGGALEALTHPDHPCHDDLMRGLVIHSHRSDEDATLLLLAALRPALWKLAHLYHRGRPQAAFDDLLVSAVHVIARCDPVVDRVYSRIVGRIRAATPPARHRSEEQPLADVNGRAAGGDDDMVDRLDARDRLERLAELRRSGAIDETLWDDLVATRVHGIPARDLGRGRSPDHVRADLSRFSRRLQRLLAA